MKDFIFGNISGYRPAVLLKKEFFLKHFSKILPTDFSWQNYRTAILKKTFSIRTLRVAASVYVKNFLKKTKDVNISKVLTGSFTSRVSRTFATYKAEFFVTLAVSSKLAHI